MNERSGYGALHLLTAFLGGAVAGAAAALLLAPQSGRETRAQIAGKLDQGRDFTKRIPDAVKGAGGAAKEAFTKAMEQT
jgi:gas vesicle protein